MTQSTIQNIPGTHTSELQTAIATSGDAQTTRVKHKAAPGDSQLPGAAVMPEIDPLLAQKACGPTSPDKALEKLDKALGKLQTANAEVDNYLSDFSEILRYIGAVLIKNAEAMRQSALNDRIAARDSARGALLGQAGKLHEAADKARTLAYTSLALTVAVSLASAALTGVSLRNTLKESSIIKTTAKEVASLKTDIKNLESLHSRVSNPDEVKVLSRKLTEAKSSIDSITEAARDQREKLQRVSQMADLGNRINSSIGNVTKSAEAIQQADIRSTEADGNLMGAYAQFDLQKSDTKKDLYDKVVDLIQQSINTYRNLQHSQAEAMRAVTRS